MQRKKKNQKKSETNEIIKEMQRLLRDEDTLPRCIICDYYPMTPNAPKLDPILLEAVVTFECPRCGYYCFLDYGRLLRKYAEKHLVD